MRPKSYTKQGNVIVFHYSFSQLREFITHGKKHGDNGWLLTKAVGNMHTLKGYGTIEHPCKEMIKITIQHHELFDGIFNPDWLIGVKIKPVYTPDSHKLIYLDFNHYGNNEN